MIEETIKSLLFAYAGLTALVSTRIYPLVLPQEAILPAVTYFVVSDVPEHAMGSDTTLRTVRLQVSSWADTYFGAKAVDVQVKAALSRVKTGVQDILVDNVMDEYEPDTDVYQIIRDFTVFP